MKPEITYKSLNLNELIKENKRITKRAKQLSLLTCNLCFKIITNNVFTICIEKEDIIEERTYCTSCSKEISWILKSLNIPIKKRRN